MFKPHILATQRSSARLAIMRLSATFVPLLSLLPLALAQSAAWGQCTSFMLSFYVYAPNSECLRRWWSRMDRSYDLRCWLHMHLFEPVLLPVPSCKHSNLLPSSVKPLIVSWRFHTIREVTAEAAVRVQPRQPRPLHPLQQRLHTSILPQKPLESSTSVQQQITLN